MEVKLVYVDEEESQAMQVARAAWSSGHFKQDEIFTMFPEPDLSNTIEKIDAQHCDALITDYRLSECLATVTFNGADLVMAYQKRFTKFPCFIATAFAGDAIEESIDTNIVFPKSDFLRATKSGATGVSDLSFFKRVRRKVEDPTLQCEVHFRC